MDLIEKQIGDFRPSCVIDLSEKLGYVHELVAELNEYTQFGLRRMRYVVADLQRIQDALDEAPSSSEEEAEVGEGRDTVEDLEPDFGPDDQSNPSHSSDEAEEGGQLSGTEGTEGGDLDLLLLWGPLPRVHLERHPGRA